MCGIRPNNNKKIMDTDQVLAEVWGEGGAQNVAVIPPMLPKSAAVHGGLITSLLFSSITSFASFTVEKK